MKIAVVYMADRESRATYTAQSDSVVGLILLAFGAFGVIARWLGIGAVLAIFTSMASVAILAAAGLDDVSGCVTLLTGTETTAATTRWSPAL